jgi:hypothetical protein
MRLVSFGCNNAKEHVRRTTHCKHGHELTPETTILNKRGSIVCRICSRASYRKYQQRHAREILDLKRRIFELEALLAAKP